VVVTLPALRGALRRVYAPPATSKQTSATISRASDSAGRFTAVSEAPDACVDISPRSTSVCSPSKLDGSTSGNELRFHGIVALFTVKFVTEEVRISSNTVLLHTHVNTNRQPTWDTMQYCGSIRPVGGELAATESRNLIGLRWLCFGLPMLARGGLSPGPVAAPAASPVLWDACSHAWQV